MGGRPPMFFHEINPYAPETIVLLHVLFSCSLEWKQVAPKLTEYHLLIPDLPCHSASKDTCRKDDFSLELAADHVANMIRQKAHDGRAHLVGLSTGGFVSLELIRKYPDLVNSVFISGAWPFTGVRAAVAKTPRLTYSAVWALLHSPGYLFFRASGFKSEYQNEELLTEIKKNGIWDEQRLIEVARADKRICLVVGGKGHDHMGEAIQAANTLRAHSKGGPGSECRVFLVRDAIHAWNLSLPKTFAGGIQAWLRYQQMPDEFERIPI
ncbi:alpha/beta-hydrolase [Cryphonectria parasitica EP155]|uniref:Alpha/beta-hydrolase n=1 Tax=Cryphonectria parasitica (strain ATCC 38755 / EP155) TaxID=660469 RepID=A0A9P4XWP2_CRYP1|nr:alpha/beta-hydrolase [Cryphonectria parasitica EP155]KAF3762192.1 alpha/beta-hydrolase [Cryphonectria parasitica EP155]